MEEEIEIMGNSMSPSKPDSEIRIYTPPELAKQIVEHFKPSGAMLEPCRGKGAFYNAMVEFAGSSSQVFWCEIDEGKDFLSDDFTADCQFSWICTNTPWGRLFVPFLQKSMAISDNVVFLANANVWMSKHRLKLVKEAGFGIVEMLMVPTPPKPWPQTGYAQAAVWIRKGWTGSTHIHDLEP